MHPNDTNTTNEAHVVSEADYAQMYAEQRTENERLNRIIETARLSPQAAPKQNVKAVVTAEQVRAQVGLLAFHKMTRSERLIAVGASPDLSDEFLKKCFGKHQDANLSRDLHRTDPARHALLRQAALITGAYAA